MKTQEINDNIEVHKLYARHRTESDRFIKKLNEFFSLFEIPSERQITHTNEAVTYTFKIDKHEYKKTMKKIRQAIPIFVKSRQK